MMPECNKEALVAVGATTLAATVGAAIGFAIGQITCPYEWQTGVDDNTHDHYRYRAPEENCEVTYTGGGAGVGVGVLVVAAACYGIYKALSSQGANQVNVIEQDVQQPLILPTTGETVTPV